MSYEPSYIPQAPPSAAFQNNAPNVANASFNPAGLKPGLGAYLAPLGAAMGQGQAAMGGAPPPPQMAPSAGVHPGMQGGMDPAALQNMMQIYHTLQPSGQLGMQMQAAGVGTQPQQPAPIPGLLSRFQ